MRKECMDGIYGHLGVQKHVLDLLIITYKVLNV